MMKESQIVIDGQAWTLREGVAGLETFGRDDDGLSAPMDPNWSYATVDPAAHTISTADESINPGLLGCIVNSIRDRGEVEAWT